MEQQPNLIGSCEPQQIETKLAEIALLTGNRPPAEVQKNAMIDFMQKYMKTVDLDELKTAFEWSIAGRLGREHERKQALTMPVVKEVWDTYNKRTQAGYNKEKTIEPVAQSRYMDFYKEGDRLVAYHPMQNQERIMGEFIEFLRYLCKKLTLYVDDRKTPVISTSFVYDIFDKAGIIELDKDDWAEINESEFNPRGGVKEELNTLDKNPMNAKAFRYWLKNKFTPKHLMDFKQKIADACRRVDFTSDAVYFEIKKK